MKRIIISFIAIFSVLLLQAKDWMIIGNALEQDTTVLKPDASNASVFNYYGTFSNESFKVTDGTKVYVPTCGMSDPMGEEVNLVLQQDSSESGFRVKYVNPEKLYVFTLRDGVIPTIKVDQAVPLEHLYLVGGPVNTHDPNWVLGDARELEKDADNPFVFYYKGFLKYNTFGDERGSIKFLTSNSSWSPAYHPDGNSNVALSRASNMRMDGADTKWEIPADGSGNGYYIIRLNTLDETIAVEEFVPADVDYPGTVYITGEAMPCGWVNDVPETMKTEDIFHGRYSWTGNVRAGQFKFLKVKNSWGSCYVSTVEDQKIEFKKEYPVVYEFEYYFNGGKDYKFVFPEQTECTIILDLSQMKLTVDAPSTAFQSLKETDQSIRIGVKNGIVSLYCLDDTTKKLAVFETTGQKILDRSFNKETEFQVKSGLYIMVITDQMHMTSQNLKLSV